MSNEIRRKVPVKGSGGVDATVTVTVHRDTVWLSIQPPFTWNAIMKPGNVEELMHVLGAAQEEAKKMARMDRCLPRPPQIGPETAHVV